MKSNTLLDSASQLLIPYLQSVNTLTLWYADESAAPLLQQIQAQPNIQIITNRYHIFQIANAQGFRCEFTDFYTKDYKLEQPVQTIIYRLSKEKALVHYLLNQSAQLLDNSGELIISGEKQDGIKTYSDKIKKQLMATGQLKKQGNAYLGKFTQLNHQASLDDQGYEQIRLLNVQGYEFYSKPGVFGWDKIDIGTALLLDSLTNIFLNLSPKPKTALDLGCGYGWIFINLDSFALESITATDNNAAALLCAEKNKEKLKTPVNIIPSDCANIISDKFDLILCNPPFHQGKQHSQALTQQFIDSAHRHLQANGMALFVVNEFIPIEKLAATSFSQIEVINQQQHFKCILLSK